MAKAGDTYIITLKKSHIDWGTYRYTGSRGDVCGEGYLPIPHDVAVRLNIMNSNGTHGADELGKNLFRCTSEDGYFNGFLRAQGCNSAGEIIAKQFAADKELKAIGTWYARIGAHEGSKIKVTWISETEIMISLIGGMEDSLTKQKRPQPRLSTDLKSNNNPTNQSPNTKLAQTSIPFPLKVGDQLKHKSWGEGTVVSVDGPYFVARFSVGDKKFSNPGSFTAGFVQKV